ATAPDDAHDVAGPFAAQRHKIEQSGFALGADDLRLDDQRVASVAPRPASFFVPGRDPPMAIVPITQQRREHRGRIKTRPAQPVDRTVAANERGGLAITDQRIVFDTAWHRGSQSKTQPMNEAAAAAVPASLPARGEMIQPSAAAKRCLSSMPLG